jgi:hypothetical protein
MSTSYKILSNILLSRLTPYGDEMIGDHQGDNRSITYYIFYICQILEDGHIMVHYIRCLEVSRKPTIQLGGKYYRIFSLNLEYPEN